MRLVSENVSFSTSVLIVALEGPGLKLNNVRMAVCLSFPFIAAVGAGTLSLILFSPENMLLISIILGTLILMSREKLTQKNISINNG